MKLKQNKNQKLLSIILPVYNEQGTILKVLQKLNQIKLEKYNYEIIVINDGSTDQTYKILKKNNHLYNELITYKKNMGKGNAVKKGILMCNGGYIIFQDADLEYDPKNIEDFIKIINKLTDVDVIIGSRFNYKNFTRSHNFYNKIGNWLITNFFNILYSTTFTDIYSCYLCFKKDLLKNENLKTLGFEQHAEILCKVIKNGKKFYEIPIDYDGRGYNEGKKIRYYHIFKVFIEIIKGRIRILN